MNLKTRLASAIAVCTIFAGSAAAQCGTAPPQMAALARSAMLWPEPSLPEAAVQPNASEDSGTQIVGLWRIKFRSGGVIVDEGWDTFHSDGSEILIDTPFGSVCPGVWEKTGPRTHKLNHPYFNFDAAGQAAVSVGIYRAQITLAADGNSFTGSFTWDSYDFSGKLIPAAHVAGTLAAKRVTSDSVPFF
jgi:hypothetical protein